MASSRIKEKNPFYARHNSTGLIKKYEYLSLNALSYIHLRDENNCPVYVGRETETKKEVQIKEINVNNDESMARYRKEHKCLGKLNHPNVIASICHMHDKYHIGRIVLTFDTCETLKEYISRTKTTISDEKIMDYSKQLFEGLDYIHKKKLVHCQIQPENILIEEEKDVLKLINFSQVKGDNEKVDEKLASSYSAPEVKFPGVISTKSDIFSSGLVIKEMSDINDTQNRILEEIVQNTIQEQPERRKAAHELLQDLESTNISPTYDDIGNSETVSIVESVQTGITVQPVSSVSGKSTIENCSQSNRSPSNTSITFENKSEEKGRSSPPNDTDSQDITRDWSSDKNVGPTNEPPNGNPTINFIPYTHDVELHKSTDMMSCIRVRPDLSIGSQEIEKAKQENDLIALCKMCDHDVDEQYHLQSLSECLTVIQNIFQKEPPKNITDQLQECENIIRCQLEGGLKPHNFERYNIRLKRIEVHFTILSSLYTLYLMGCFHQSDIFNLNVTPQHLRNLYALVDCQTFCETKRIFTLAQQIGEQIIQEIKKGKRNRKTKEMEVFKMLTTLLWKKEGGSTVSSFHLKTLIERITGLQVNIDRLCCIYLLSYQVPYYQHAIKMIQQLYKCNSKGEIADFDEAIAMSYINIKILCRITQADDYKLLLEKRNNHLGIPLSTKGSTKESFINKWKASVRMIATDLLFHQHIHVKETVEDTIYNMKNHSIIEKAKKYKRILCEMLSGSHFVLEPTDNNCVQCSAIKMNSSILEHHSKWFGQMNNKSIELNLYTDEGVFNADNEINVLKKLSQNSSGVQQMKLLAFQNQIIPKFYIIETVQNLRNLTDFLIDMEKLQPSLSLAQLCRFSLLVVSAIEYCHQQGVLVRNITAASFGIQSDGNVIKLLPNHQSVVVTVNKDNSLQYHGTADDYVPVRWCAPESLIPPYIFNESSEIYMVGRTIMQILLFGRFPFHNSKSESYVKKMEEFLVYGKYTEHPKCIPTTLFRTLNDTFFTTPHHRLSMSQLKTELSDFIEMPLNRAENGYELNFQSNFQEQSDKFYKNHLPAKDPNQPKYPEMKIPHSFAQFTSLEDMKTSLRQAISTSHLKIEQREINALDNPSFNGNGYQCQLLQTLDGNAISKLLKLEHKNLLKITQVLTVNGNQIMYLRPGCHQNLLTYILRSDHVSDREIRTYFSEICEAVKYLHDENLLIGYLPSKYIYLADNNTLQIGCLARIGQLELSEYDNDYDTVSVHHLISSGHLHDNQDFHDMVRYVPREVNENGKFSKRGDVGAIALTFIELLYARDMTEQNHLEWIPYSTLPITEVLEKQCLRTSLKLPRSTPHWLKSLLTSCMLCEPSYLRSDIKEILEILKHPTPSSHRVIKDSGKRATHLTDKAMFYEMEASMYDTNELNPPTVKENDLPTVKEDDEYSYVEPLGEEENEENTGYTPLYM